VKTWLEGFTHALREFLWKIFIEQINKCYRTVGYIILNTGNDELVKGCVGWQKVANRLLREKKNQLLTETMRAPRAEEEVGQLWKANK